MKKPHKIMINNHIRQLWLSIIMDLSDQELSVALEEFERTRVHVSDLFLLFHENRLDQTITCAAVESGAMRFAVFV